MRSTEAFLLRVRAVRVLAPVLRTIVPAFAAPALLALALASCADESAAPTVSSGCNPACSPGYVCSGVICVPNPGPNPTIDAGPTPTGCNPPCPTGQMCSGDRCVARPKTCNPICPQGQSCYDGVCKASPTGCNPPCSSDQTCRNGVCVTSTMPREGRPIGSECMKNADCADSVCFNPQYFPGGYCSKTCGGDVISQGAECPPDSACYRTGETTAFCLDACQSNADCRAAYTCATSPSGRSKACIPKCQTNDDCPVDKPCNVTTGLCEVATAPQTNRPVGAPCKANTECASSVCITEQDINGAFPGGYCVDLCTAAEENKSCAGGKGFCLGHTDSMGQKGYICFGACSTGTDCRPEYMCSADAKVMSAEGVGMCLPRCDRYMCDPGETCDQSVGICTPGGPTPDTASVSVVNFGTISVGEAESTWKSVTVDVPANAISYTLIADSAAPYYLGVVRIKAPNGQIIFDGNDPNPDIAIVVTQKSRSVVLFPNAPRTTLVPGKYEVTYGSESATPIPVKVDGIIKRQTGVAQSGSLPVVLWFTENSQMTAATAPRNQNLQTAIATVKEIYAKIGITIGPIKYQDVPAPIGRELAVITDRSQLPRLFAVANTSSEQALHFFMIDQFNVEGSPGLLGISGGIPGPPAFPNLPHGGVAVSLAFIDEVDTFAETMAHEGGHFLGLFHVSERTGDSFDPLLDTPECPASNDRDNNGLVSADECVGKGADNLMFWGAADIPQRTLTPDQRFVLLRNPSVQ